MRALMRLSPQRHTLAVLRTIIGITQKEMAELLECSAPTVQAIELGKLKLSIKLAGNLFNQTSVDLDWLMNDDVTQPAIDFEGEPYTRETFEMRQAGLFSPPQDTSDVKGDLRYVGACFRNSVEVLAILFAHAYRDSRVQMCDYKVTDALDELLDETVGTDALTPEEKERSMKFRLDASEPKDLRAVIDGFLKDTDAIFQARLAEFQPAKKQRSKAHSKKATHVK